MTETNPDLIKMNELARLSGVPAPTIKHYMKMDLLPGPSLRTSRNMAWYDPTMVPRIKAIKELQRSRFLPLDVIKQVLDGTVELENTERVASAVGRVLNEVSPKGEFTRAQLQAMGVDDGEIRTLGAMGLLEPKVVAGVEVVVVLSADQGLDVGQAGIDLLRRQIDPPRQGPGVALISVQESSQRLFDHTGLVSESEGPPDGSAQRVP